MAGRLSKLRQRFGIAAPKVSVRTHVPWYLRWFGLAALLVLSVAFAFWAWDTGRRFAGFDRSEVEQELAAARGELAKLREELERLRALAARLGLEKSVIFAGLRTDVPRLHAAADLPSDRRRAWLLAQGGGDETLVAEVLADYGLSKKNR